MNFGRHADFDCLRRIRAAGRRDGTLVASVAQEGLIRPR
jgi:acyl-CoA thioesterase